VRRTPGSSEKLEARAFLDGLQDRFAKRLLPARELDLAIRDTNAKAKGNRAERHLKHPESAFLNKHALPEIFKEIRHAAGLSDESARRALLNEYYPSTPGIAEASPAHTKRHPFTKALGLDAAAIYTRWTDPSAGSALVQSCPDFALRDPFPHKIVFEGKYFRKGSAKYAKQELVKYIYEAFFYRGLPSVPETPRGRAAFNYDYPCLLAYDASRGGTLTAAWNALPAKVQNGFWDGANLYVMILGGDG